MSLLFQARYFPQAKEQLSKRVHYSTISEKIEFPAQEGRAGAQEDLLVIGLDNRKMGKTGTDFFH